MSNINNDNDLLIAKQELRIKKLKLTLDFIKFMLVLIVVYFVSSLIEKSFREREVSLRETDQMGRFLETALNKEVWVRKLFAEYFSTITRDQKNRDLWKNYYNVVCKEFNEHKKQDDSLQSIRVQESLAKDSLNLLNTTSPNTHIQNQIKRINQNIDNLDRQIWLHRKEITPVFQSEEIEQTDNYLNIRILNGNKMSIAMDIQRLLKGFLSVTITNIDLEKPQINKNTTPTFVLTYSSRTLENLVQQIQSKLHPFYSVKTSFDNTSNGLVLTIK